MHANELRIGNWIKDTAPANTAYQVTSITDEVIECTGMTIWEIGFRDEHYIPLTEEWLLKFGFKGLEYWTDMKTGWFTIDERDGFYKLSYSDNNIGNQFQYVHQLQNLYFALTGTELKLITQ